MKNLTLVCIVLAFLFLPWEANHSIFQTRRAERGALLKGTLIVFVSTKDGLVICADKRLTDDNGHFTDTANKLTQLGPSIAFAVGGVPYIEDERGAANEYNAIGIVKTYFSGTTFKDTDQFWFGLKKNLFDSFVNYLQRRTFENWPPSLFPDAEYSFTQLLFFYLDEAQTTKIRLIRLKYIKEMIGPTIEVRSFVVKPNGLYDSLGWGKLDIELKKGTDKRFDDLRSDPQMKPFLFNLVPAEEVRAETAVAFSKKLMRVSSEKGHMLGASQDEIGIGPTCDCGIVSPQAGFKWLAQNADVQ